MESQCESKSYTWKSALSPTEGSVKTAAMGLLEPRHFQSPGRNECIMHVVTVLTSRGDLNQIATRTPFPSRSAGDKAGSASVGGDSATEQTDCSATNWEWPFRLVPPRLGRFSLDKWLKWRWPTAPWHAGSPFNLQTPSAHLPPCLCNEPSPVSREG